MFKKKYKQFLNSTNKPKLDQVLWFLRKLFTREERSMYSKKLYMDNLEAETIKKLSKLTLSTF